MEVQAAPPTRLAALLVDLPAAVTDHLVVAVTPEAERAPQVQAATRAVRAAPVATQVAVPQVADIRVDIDLRDRAVRTGPRVPTKAAAGIRTATLEAEFRPTQVAPDTAEAPTPVATWENRRVDLKDPLDRRLRLPADTPDRAAATLATTRTDIQADTRVEDLRVAAILLTDRAVATMALLGDIPRVLETVATTTPETTI